jgi:hypothetical protein
VAHEIHTSDVRLAPETRYGDVTSGLEGLRTDVMKTSTRISRAGWAVAVGGLLLVLYGCGSSSGSADAAHSKQKGAASQRVSDPSARAPQDMVAAVSVGKGGPPVGLKFELGSVPEAGQSFDLDLVVLPDAPEIERIDARFDGGENLTLVEGGDLAAVEKPAQGSVIRHVVRMLPKQDGIFTVTAAVTVTLANDSITRTFTIPVVVGEGLPELTAKSEAADGESAAGTTSKSH